MSTATYTKELDDYMGGARQDFPARFATAIAPSDTLAVAIGPGSKYAKALYVGVTGNITLITAGDASSSGLGTPVLFSNVPVGWFPVQVRQVLVTGTSATNLVGVCD